MPRTREAFEEMRIKSKNIIMETALKLFSEKGYHSTSISMIAKEAGVAVGLMYHYFSGKEELLKNIMDDNFQHIFSFVMDTLHKDSSVVDSGNIDLSRLIDIIFEAINNTRESWKLLISVMFQPDVSEIAIKQISELNLHQYQIYNRYFEGKGVKNPEKSAKVLASVMHGAFLNYAYTGDSEEIRLLRSTVIERLLAEGV